MKFKEYTQLNLPKVAEEILEQWKTEKTFSKSITNRDGQTPFVFYEGPPSANGMPGIHHVMARAIKDIFCFKLKPYRTTMTRALKERRIIFMHVMRIII